jgi:iron complex transport system permease protein
MVSLPEIRRRRRRLVVAAFAAVIACLALAVLSLLAGPHGLVIPTAVGGRATPVEESLIWTVRLPRTSAALLAGAALAVAGTLGQTVTRNNLCDPGLMGVSSGAMLAGVLARQLLQLRETALAWPCIAGAIVATMLVLLIHARSTTRSRSGLILIGMAVNGIAGGSISLITQSEPETFLALRLWLVGSVAGRTTDAVMASVLLILPAILCVLLMHRELDLLVLGSSRARSLGAHTRLTTAVAVVAIAWLVGVSTALAGPIAFIGLAAALLAPALLRRNGHGVLIPLTAVVGAGLLVTADLVGRIVSFPGEVPSSVVCAVVGAPLLIIIGLRDHRMRHPV